MRELEKRYEALGFTNDLIFKYVLTSDIELCRELINRIDPAINTEGIHYVESEKEIIIGVKDEKRVRLDILTETVSDVTDLEMLTYRPAKLPKTGRYNAAMIDARLTKSKLPPDLPDVSVILLCTYDPFGFGDPVYHASAKLDEHPEYDYNEGRRICILTNKGIDRAPEQLKPIIHLLSRNQDEMDDAFYRKIQAAVREIKTDPEVRRAAMNQLEKEDAIQREAMEKGEEKGIEKGIEIGREEGRKEGRKEGREEKEKEDLSAFVEVLKSVGTEEETAISLISEKFGKSPEEVREILTMQAQTH